LCYINAKRLDEKITFTSISAAIVFGLNRDLAKNIFGEARIISGLPQAIKAIRKYFNCSLLILKLIIYLPV